LKSASQLSRIICDSAATELKGGWYGNAEKAVLVEEQSTCSENQDLRGMRDADRGT